MGRIILVTGGARSGKSRYAEELIAGCGDDIVYIATARAMDTEMTERIARHRVQRPASWRTVECPTRPSAVVAAEGGHAAGILLDCLTVMITNRMLAHPVDWQMPTVAQMHLVETDVLAETEAIVSAVINSRADLVAVTNEVGYGIVPLSPMARFFRDCAGRVNQRMATAAAEVFLVVAGIPMRIKGH
ncbi:bifunctional adenosylcobinamide kinase/adenosylcobinamide-phosphate guanylyltransferase [Desulfobulbus alkaliphilus]|uniref:bifunctional adenosylcobinamide kinase/adenosylcobinamide-phosphate guanylyltransferase n=1 Tax=Desulfobulbus alkaliphilus TaxID=869814 RepID=UPI001963B4EF|nr:bifunctional adenosylcobinamide kinase/adenosylcobinamide-phosphate guanylyltransferase [Desulfobulbus alkaliphilus]MBM9536910.1 bifunctional adenosylcobinamide kinase/adenosylcobinamide-phosphate guanylyltransferase [Desulfobulbus alkaliphilus]